MASNNDGVWNEAGAAWNFSIVPAYYQTVWFQGLCVAAFLALLGGLYQLRLKQMETLLGIRMEERVNERRRSPKAGMRCRGCAPPRRLAAIWRGLSARSETNLRAARMLPALAYKWKGRLGILCR
jgi:hypothetical protein